MADFNTLITRVLDNVGRADAAEDRSRVMRFLLDILRVDIPDRAAGMYAKGNAVRVVGGAVYESTGIYYWPALLRSFGGAIQVDGEVINEHQIYTHEQAFLQATSQLGSTDFSYSTAHILMHGRLIYCKPVPANAPTASVILTLWGTVYRNVSAITVNTTTAALGIEELEPTLEAGATMLEAATRQRADLTQVWAPIWQRRLDGLSGADRTNYRQQTMGRDV